MPSAHCERESEGLQSFADHPRQFEPETQYSDLLGVFRTS